MCFLDLVLETRAIIGLPLGAGFSLGEATGLGFIANGTNDGKTDDLADGDGRADVLADGTNDGYSDSLADGAATQNDPKHIGQGPPQSASLPQPIPQVVREAGFVNALI